MGHHGAQRPDGDRAQVGVELVPGVGRGGYLCEGGDAEGHGIAEYRGGCLGGRCLQRQAVLGMIGRGPELVAPLVGGSGSEGDLLEDLPVPVSAGIVYQPEQAIQVAVGERLVQASSAHGIRPPTRILRPVATGHGARWRRRAARPPRRWRGLW